MSYDRYKACRRHCAALRVHIESHPELIEQAKDYFKKKTEDNEEKSDLFGVKYIGKNLPDARLGCKMCSFIAKSERGLRIHMKRTHKVKAAHPKESE